MKILPHLRLGRLGPLERLERLARPGRWPAHLGSARVTIGLLALLGAVALAAPGFVLLSVVIALLALNLAAALVVHPRLRRDGALLVAHLALLALVAAVGLGRLMALDGRFELTEGVAFDGQLLDRAAGPLHRDRLQRLSFRHEGFEIDYAAGRRRGATRNTVAWVDADGELQRAVIGDHVPLVLDGHRIYTSSNKGFAPLLQWTPAQGQAQLGAVHLPSYPMHELRQSRSWTLPDGRELWVMLALDEELIDPARAGAFRMPGRHHLVLRLDEQRHELAPGDTLALPGGQLRYVGLRTWMGYRVSHDPTLPWLLAAALLATAAFAWHYALRFARPPEPARGRLTLQGAEVIDG